MFNKYLEAFKDAATKAYKTLHPDMRIPEKDLRDVIDKAWWSGYNTAKETVHAEWYRKWWEDQQVDWKASWPGDIYNAYIQGVADGGKMSKEPEEGESK